MMRRRKWRRKEGEGGEEREGGEVKDEVRR